MATQTYGGLTAEQKTFYDRVLLERLLPNLVFMKYGQKRTIPKREGATVNFRRFNSLAPATTPLTEGVTPSGSNLSVTAITATVQQYGDFVLVSDFLDLAGIDPVITETTELLGEQAAETLDIVVRDVVAAGTNVYYVGGRTARNQVLATDVLTGADIRKARTIMAKNKAKPVPGAGAYIGFVHPFVAGDIMADSLWIDVNKYAGAQKIFNGEIGKLYGIRFIETTLAPIWVGAGGGTPPADVFGTIIIGANAYGVPDIAGSSKPETIIKPLGSAGTADPLNQRASVGWKAALATARLDELCILRIESGATAV